MHHTISTIVKGVGHVTSQKEEFEVATVALRDEVTPCKSSCDNLQVEVVLAKQLIISLEA